MKKIILTIVVLAVIGGGTYAYYMRKGTPEPTVSTMQLSRGDVAETVQATGTLQAVKTVNVGTQVSGVVQALYADFNHIVKKGQIIARLDPSLIETAIEQREASVIRAQADIERLEVSLADAKRKLEQAKAMWEKQLIPRDQLDTAELNVKTTEAQIKSSRAGLEQAQADLNTQRVNLGHTVIKAPIDGIVIQRSVDEGQTVASSMNAPTLYIIAADLTKMQVVANIDEADVGRMRPGQAVTFRVDAYPTDTFTGSVAQVRLQPAVVQNVVTYSTVISVPNPELKLKPGMTANVTIEIARRDNVLRVPNRALSFRPTEEMFAVLNQPVPQELQRGRGGFGPRGREGQRAGGQAGGNQPAAGQPGTGNAERRGQPQAPAPQGVQANAGDAREARPDSPQARGGGDGGAPAAGGFGGRGQGRGGFDPNMTPEERQRRREERLKNMTPEQRAEFEQRMREGGGRGGFGGFGGGADGRRNNAVPADAPSRTMASGATTIDSLFAPIQTVERPGLAWLYQGNQLKPLRLRLGVSDATFTEIVNDGEIPPNTEVVVGMTTGLEQRTQPAGNQQGNPLMGPQRGGRGGGGGRRGGG
jgi:HlyD family secretion protein